jgi:hypothetical protein
LFDKLENKKFWIVARTTCHNYRLDMGGRLNYLKYASHIEPGSTISMELGSILIIEPGRFKVLD